MFEFIKPKEKTETETTNDLLNIENAAFHTQAAVNTFKDNTDYQSLVYQAPVYDDVPDYKATSISDIAVVVDNAQVGLNESAINEGVKIVDITDDLDGAVLDMGESVEQNVDTIEIVDFDNSGDDKENNSEIIDFSANEENVGTTMENLTAPIFDQTIEVEDYVHKAEPGLPSIFASQIPPSTGDFFSQNNNEEDEIKFNKSNSIFESTDSNDNGLSSVSSFNGTTANDELDKLSLFGSKNGVSNMNSYSSSNQFEEEKQELQQAVEYTEDGYKVCPNCGAILNPNAPVCFMCSKSFVLKK